MTTPKIRKMAIAYRIYCDCEMWGWNRTIREIAETVGEDKLKVREALRRKGWIGRVKSVSGNGLDMRGGGMWGDSGRFSEDVDAHMILDQYT